MSGSRELILELDKLIRSDRAKLAPSRLSNNRRAEDGSYVLSGMSPCSRSSVSETRPRPAGSDMFICAPRVAETDSFDASPSSSNGNDPMRQVRLFKTRFCQYGTDCPYLVKGTCLYAHNRDEVRLRPPPPKGYKPVPSPVGVWRSSTSILDCLPARDSPAHHSVTGLITLTSLANQLAILEAAKEEIDAKVQQRQFALERWFPTHVIEQSFELLNQIRQKEYAIHSLKIELERITMLIAGSPVRTRIPHTLLPRRSHIVKACNAQLDLAHNALAKVSGSLSMHRMQLLQEVSSLYPIDYQGRFRTIRGLALPSVSALKRSNDVRDEETISTALGSLVHRIQLMANIVDFPLLLIPVIAGSKSIVKDRFSSNSASQELPLFYKGSDRSKYVAAIQLLIKTLMHFAVSRGKTPENTNDLLEIAEHLLAREMMPDS